MKDILKEFVEANTTITEEVNQNERITELLTGEDNNPIRLFYLSFADDSGFKGAILTEAKGPISAVKKTHDLKINPGGEVLIIEHSGLDIQLNDRDRLLQLPDLKSIFGDIVNLAGENK